MIIAPGSEDRMGSDLAAERIVMMPLSTIPGLFPTEPGICDHDGCASCHYEWPRFDTRETCPDCGHALCPANNRRATPWWAPMIPTLGARA